MSFNKFAKSISKKFDEMTSEPIFRVDIDKDTIWEAYLDAFPNGTNEIYIKCTEHDCQTCRQFVQRVSNAVCMHSDGTLDTVWNAPNLEEPYATVAKLLHALVLNKPIKSIFLHNEPSAGKETTFQQLEDGSIKTWHHFYAKIPDILYERDIATVLNESNGRADTHARSLKEISISSLNTVIDLINNKSLYRGNEHLGKLTSFLEILNGYEFSQNQRDYVWNTFKLPGAGIRSTVIGSLLLDLEKGIDLETAVKSFENKVAPANYKRPKTLVTKRMVELAIKEIDKQGIRDSLPRRHALTTDVSINDIIYVDRSTKLSDVDPLMDLANISEPVINAKSLKNATEISIDSFLESVIPGSESVQILTNKNTDCNKVQISAPVNQDAPNILQWDNNFSWSYSGNVTDSIITKEVAKAGGKTDGLLRFSLMWNENGRDIIDLDAHAYENPGNHIHFGKKVSYISGGTLDVDIQTPRGIAVENIIWQNLPDMNIDMKIHHYSGSPLSDSFKCEIVFDGNTYSYEYSGKMACKNTIEIATVKIKDGVISINHHLPVEESLASYTAVPVHLIMLSPNHWGENSSGNKHFMFMTNDSKSSIPFRGFYNEFLKPSLHDIRKSMDMLASKMMVEPTENGLSGYGFSSTSKSIIHMKVDNRLYKVKV